MEQGHPEVELTGFARLSTEITSVVEPKPEISDHTQIILNPGSKIKPQVSEEDAVRLAERLYGISTRDISELVSYDDKNFLIHVDT